MQNVRNEAYEFGKYVISNTLHYYKILNYSENLYLSRIISFSLVKHNTYKLNSFRILSVSSVKFINRRPIFLLVIYH